MGQCYYGPVGMAVDIVLDLLSYPGPLHRRVGVHLDL